MVFRFYNVTRFLSISAKFDIFTAMVLNETLVEAKICIFKYPKRVFLTFSASTSFPFRPTTVQMPNFALSETKRITVSLTIASEP